MVQAALREIDGGVTAYAQCHYPPFFYDDLSHATAPSHVLQKSHVVAPRVMAYQGCGGDNIRRVRETIKLVSERIEKFSSHRVSIDHSYSIVIFGRESDSLIGASDCITSQLRSLTQVVGTSNVSKVDDFLEVLEKECAAGDIDHAVDHCFDLIERAFYVKDLALVNDLLSRAISCTLHHRVKVGMLRSTFRARSYLKSWNFLLHAAALQLELEGKKSNKILRGLIGFRNDDKQLRILHTPYR